MKTHGVSLATLAAAALLLACEPDQAPFSPSEGLDAAARATFEIFLSPNGAGRLGTVSTAGTIDRGNAFFRSFGTNGRTCGSCHFQANAFGLSAEAARAVFAASGGRDPLFAPFDGANCPSVTAADGAAGHSLLLNQGLIRVGLTVPAGAEYTITAVHDPYGCALRGSPAEASVYRRVLPTTNLRFLSAVMWDGRETVQPLTDRNTLTSNLRAGLLHQAMDATLGHAQAARSPTPAQLNSIVDFELALFTAQQTDNARRRAPGQSREPAGPQRWQRRVLPRHQRSAGRQSYRSGVRPQRVHSVQVLEGPGQLRAATPSRGKRSPGARRSSTPTRLPSPGWRD